MIGNQNIPKLRFPGFEGEWEKSKLLTRVKTIDSGWSPQCEEFPSKKDEWGVLKTTSVVWEGFNESANKKLPEKLNPRPELEVSINDILITRAGPTSRVGVTVHVNKVREKLMLSDKLIRIRSNEITSSLFLAILLSNNNIQKQLVSKSSGLAESQTNISQKILLNTQITLPTLPEQQKIASFLSAVDEKIQQLSRKKELLEHYKKGVMQQLFSGKLRFKDEKGKDYPDWEEKKLGEISNIKKGQQLNKIELTDSGEFLCINGGISPSGYTDKFNTLENTITISEGGNSCGFINFFRCKFWSGGHNYTIEIIKPEETDNYFMFQILKHNQINIMGLRVGSGLPNIQKKDLFAFLIKLPTSIKEQQKIANFLSSIDAKIENTKGELEKIQLFKKGLLQQLFV